MLNMLVTEKNGLCMQSVPANKRMRMSILELIEVSTSVPVLLVHVDLLRRQ